MPAPAPKGPRKATVKCSECGTEGEVTLNRDDSVYEGKCSECGWDIGAAYTKYRRDRAVRELDTPSEPEKKKKGTILDW